MQNVEIMEMLSKIKFSFNLIDIEILTHTHIMKYSAHKFHCDLWHAFLTVFANAISLHHFDSILFHFVDRHTEQNALKYQVLDGIVWFDFFSICITSQSGAWILCLIERKFNVHYAIVWCSTWLIIILVVYFQQNTRIHE